jgi:hypothetical protein
MSKLEGTPDLGNLSPEQWEQMGLTREEFEENIARMKEREKIAPAVGDMAPAFELKRLSSEGKLTDERVCLSDLRGRPLALILGSYT